MLTRDQRENRGAVQLLPDLIKGFGKILLDPRLLALGKLKGGKEPTPELIMALDKARIALEQASDLTALRPVGRALSPILIENRTNRR